MNLSRCQKGHFYDAEKYSSCPHCMGGAGADNSLTAAFTDDITVASNTFASDTVPAMDSQVQPMVAPPGIQFPIADFPADQATIGGIISGESLTIPLDEKVTEPISNDVPTQDSDHTIGFYDSDLFSNASNATDKVAVKSNPVNKMSGPCVGWLIALGGKHLGRDFRLKVGKNFVGRSANMDVALTDDVSVSREKHAIVVYEPKEHLYLVQPGEASTLVYKNEAVVLEPVKLEAYDVISVGDVNLLFIPLCNKQFNWSDLLEEMQKNSEK